MMVVSIVSFLSEYARCDISCVYRCRLWLLLLFALFPERKTLHAQWDNNSNNNYTFPVRDQVCISTTLR